ncbi:MAG: hypothetical protein VW338_00190 [Rhodospirillaceae bacterium]
MELLYLISQLLVFASGLGQERTEPREPPRQERTVDAGSQSAPSLSPRD